MWRYLATDNNMEHTQNHGTPAGPLLVLSCSYSPLLNARNTRAKAMLVCSWLKVSAILSLAYIPVLGAQVYIYRKSICLLVACALILQRAE